MANASLPEIIKKLGEDNWILEHLTEAEARKMGEDLEGFHKAMRKSIYSIRTVLGLSGDEANQAIADQLRIHLNSMTTTSITPEP